MQAKGFVRNGVVNLADGESQKKLYLEALPPGPLTLESIGVNGFSRTGELYIAMGVVMNHHKQIHPISVKGKVDRSDPQHPFRILGNQRMGMQADPGSVVEISVARIDTIGEVHVNIELGGSVHSMVELMI